LCHVSACILFGIDRSTAKFQIAHLGYALLLFSKYAVTIDSTMPEKMSNEKVNILKALGAEIVRTPTEAAFDAPESHISTARRICSEMGKRAHILDQYANPSNPDAHYHGTANEIIRQCGGKIDMLVAGAGTGGTITGIAKRLKEHNPNVQIVGVDPEGSILAVPDSLNDKNRLCSYHVEGTGYDFIPAVLDRDQVDTWFKSNDKDSLLMMRRLIREEGLLCGGSSGAAVCAALHAAKSLKKGQRCVIILPDSVRNYMTKALNDDWMSDLGFIDGTIVKEKQYSSWWSSKNVYEMPINTPLTITSEVSCKDAIKLLKDEGFDMVPVLESGAVVGVVTEGNITARILSGWCDSNTSVAEAGVIYKTFHKFTMNDTLASLAKALDHDPFVLIVSEQRCFSAGNKKRKAGNGSSENGQDKMESQVETRSLVSGIVSRIDLIDFISQHGDRNTDKVEHEEK
jgi:cystathionine beta-synthase